MRVYQVSKLAPKCWQVAAFDDAPGWLGSPIIITQDAKGRKAAVTVARLLAGRCGKVVVVGEGAR